MLHGQFTLPFAYELTAVFLLAITGAMVAIEKDYDFSGVLILAFIAGASGAIIRDGIFLNKVPIMVEKWQYLAAILAGAVITALFIGLIKKFNTVFVLIDALGLGIFGIIAAQLALMQDLNVLSAVLIGIVGATTGGLLRDLITTNEPLLLKPGQYYFSAALIGIIAFIALAVYADVNAQIAAIIGIFIVFVLRVLSFALNWQSFPAVNISKTLKLNKDKENK